MCRIAPKLCVRMSSLAAQVDMLATVESEAAEGVLFSDCHVILCTALLAGEMFALVEETCEVRVVEDLFEEKLKEELLRLAERSMLPTRSSRNASPQL